MLNSTLLLWLLNYSLVFSHYERELTERVNLLFLIINKASSFSCSNRYLSAFKESFYTDLGFPVGSDGKESACSAGDPGSIPGWGRSPGEGNGYPLQYSCLENSMDRGAWWATVHGLMKSWAQLSG